MTGGKALVKIKMEQALSENPSFLQPVVAGPVGPVLLAATA
jgi:hypothetical protein